MASAVQREVERLRKAMVSGPLQGAILAGLSLDGPTECLGALGQQAAPHCSWALLLAVLATLPGLVRLLDTRHRPPLQLCHARMPCSCAFVQEEQFQTQQATLQAKLDALEAKAGGGV